MLIDVTVKIKNFRLFSHFLVQFGKSPLVHTFPTTLIANQTPFYTKKNQSKTRKKT